MSTAKKIAVFPEFDCGRLGMMSHAHDALGAKMKLVFLQNVWFWGICVELTDDAVFGDVFNFLFEN